ncbi:hypothetical protein ACFO25_14840 [Paenactinomyces guangxiensis]|uniref:Uncharacterized protein n=1 Tax=Paenactinomyces guangxiensis TaxID=1490290 RepID=A0A7W2A871_9BACL|nr:hypothetical protein [Paenactinomyces guangxiensis]MBA4493864.1 hypothetical protein [Paenactinomyces guangxiensis]MBH8591330.1 hypothetical protein [Paenactinomyces guangxiensis]
MSERYIPQITEASIPEDGAWAELENTPVLILSIPEWKEMIEQPTEGHQYVWMYDRAEDAYLFCFRLSSRLERAVAFPRDHAGLLLQDEKAHRPFSILITGESLEETKKDTPLLLLRHVQLKRHPQAGW